MSMPKRIVAVAVTVVVVVGGAVAAYILLRPNPNHPQIMLNQRYYINAMRNGLFRYLHPDTGMPLAGVDDVITLENQDPSFAVFENDWETFRISFVHNNRTTEMIFVVTDVRHASRSGSFRASVTHIYNGNLHHFSVITENDRIVMITDATALVTVASTEFTPAPVIEVLRAQSIVLMFSITAPLYRSGS